MYVFIAITKEVSRERSESGGYIFGWQRNISPQGD